MTTTRATTADLSARVERRVRRDVHAVAGGNDLVSKQEQGALTDPFLNDVANDVRAAGGPGARVHTQALIDGAVAAVEALVQSVNQPSGSGAAFISAAEVKAMLATNPVVGARVAKAYELITGRRVVADPAPPPGVTGQLGDPRLTQERLDAIGARAREVALSGDLMTGSVPPGTYILLPVLAGDAGVPQGRSYTVYLANNAPNDPNLITRAYLEAIDAQGITRVASFDLPDGLHALVTGDVQGIVEPVVANLAAWHDSGDHGVNVTSHMLPGVIRLSAALDAARAANPWTAAETDLTSDPVTGAPALERFLAEATTALEDNLPAGEDPAAITDFIAQVRASFSQLADVRLARGGDLGGLYLVGKSADGYAAVVVQSYSDG